MTAISMEGRTFDIELLCEELMVIAPEGVCVVDDYLVRRDDQWPHGELPEEAVPIVDAHDGTVKHRTAAFATAEDAERLAIVNERAQTDPAFAALADLTLGKQGVQA